MTTIVSRDDQIDGLHKLADFLASHPDVPIPHTFIHCMSDSGRQAVAQWVADLDELIVEKGSTSYSRKVSRWFAGLKVECHVPTEAVVVTTTVLREVDEDVPLSVVDILDRAAAETERLTGEAA